jgi:hypothetical protein
MDTQCKFLISGHSPGTNAYPQAAFEPLNFGLQVVCGSQFPTKRDSQIDSPQIDGIIETLVIPN